MGFSDIFTQTFTAEKMKPKHLDIHIYIIRVAKRNI